MTNNVANNLNSIFEVLSLDAGCCDILWINEKEMTYMARNKIRARISLRNAALLHNVT